MPRKALDETTLRDAYFLRYLTQGEYDALVPVMRDFLYHRAAGAEDYASYLEGVRSGRLKPEDAP